MALAAFTATLKQALTARPGKYQVYGGGLSDPSTPASPSTATVATDVAAIPAALTTAFTAFNTFAAAVIAITGDTFDTGTHQFTFGGATGLTHAQVATEFALLNTAMTDFVAVQTDSGTLTTNWATFLAAETAFRAAAATALSGDPADAVLLLDTSKITTINELKSVLENLLRSALASDKFTP